MNNKKCTKCMMEKLLEDFPNRIRDGKQGKHSWCFPCYKEYKQDYWQRNKETIAKKRKTRYEDEGLSAIHRARCKEYYQKSDKEKNRNESWSYKLRKEYGMSVDDYEIIFNKQNGLCAICLCQEHTKHQGRTIRMAVDHCHETGRIRGLLCRNCNVAIGLFKDSSELMKKAIIYLSVTSEVNGTMSTDSLI